MALAVVLPFLQPAQAMQGNTRIEWDAGTRKFACAGTYGRAKILRSGELALVYSSGADAWIRKSKDGGGTWDAAIRVAHDDGYGDTNAELLELQNGWLLYAWNGRPQAAGPYFIATRISKDGGLSWGAGVRAYTGGTDGGTGCWEPALLQLPGGEVQLYFANETPYAGASTDQEIGMLRSHDNGGTWETYLAVSHRSGARDGMPVPVQLKDGGVAVAIEDNGIPGLSGSFKPSIVRSSAGGAWGATPVGGKDPHRWGALAPEAGLASAVYGGAPYLVRLPSGETILSIQSGEGRDPGTAPTAHAIMQVYVGTVQADSFSAKSTPFPDIPAGGNGLWNSLLAVDDSTVVAVSSISGMGKNGIWAVVGKVRRESGVAVIGRPHGSGKSPPAGALIGPAGNVGDGWHGWEFSGFDARGRPRGRRPAHRHAVTLQLP